MIKFLILIASIMASQAQAQQQDALPDMPLIDISSTVPKWMRGGKIIFLPADPDMPAKDYDPEEWGIFKRANQRKKTACPKPKPTYIAGEVKTIIKTEVKTEVKTVYKKHRFSLLMGWGARGVDVDDTDRPETKTFSTGHGVLGGARYQYSMSPVWSMGAEMITDPKFADASGFMSMGWGF